MQQGRAKLESRVCSTCYGKDHVVGATSHQKCFGDVWKNIYTSAYTRTNGEQNPHFWDNPQNLINAHSVFCQFLQTPWKCQLSEIQAEYAIALKTIQNRSKC